MHSDSKTKDSKYLFFVFYLMFFVVMGWLMSVYIPEYDWMVIGAIIVSMYAIWSTLTGSYRQLLFIIIIVLVANSSVFPLGRETYYLRFVLIGLFSFWELLRVINRRRIIFNPCPLHLFMFLLIVLMTLSSVYSLVPFLSFQRAISWLLLYVAVLVSIWNYCTNMKRIKEILNILIVTAMLLMTSGFLLLFIMPDKLFMASRFQSIFVNPNSIGAFCVIFVPVLFWYFYQREPGSFMKYFSGFCIFNALVSVVWSSSRASMAAVLVSLVVMFWIVGKMRMVIVIGSLLMLFIVIVHIVGMTPQALVESSFVQNRILRTGSLETGSGRLLVWKQAWNLAIEKWVKGWGWGIVKEMFNRGIIISPLKFKGRHCHNSYLEFFLSLGIFGALLYIVSLLYVFFKGLSLIKMDLKDENFLLAVAMFSSFVGCLVNGFFESWMIAVGSAFVLPLWIEIVLMVKMYFIKQGDTSAEKLNSNIPSKQIKSNK